jgi:hypothetical protein
MKRLRREPRHANDFDVLRRHHPNGFAPGEHNPPHFHVYYNEHKASVDIQSCEIIEGDLPIKQRKLVTAWAALHQEELMGDWQLVMNGEDPFKIQPLR